MDKMEASTPTMGQYFVRFGRKDGIVATDNTLIAIGLPGHQTEDARALLLIKSIPFDQDRKMYIAITEEGPKGLVVDEEKDIRIKDIIRQKLNAAIDPYRENEPDNEGYFTPWNREKRYLRVSSNIGGKGILESFGTEKAGKLVDDVDVELVKKAIRESQTAAEIPHAVRLLPEQKTLEQLKN